MTLFVVKAITLIWEYDINVEHKAIEVTVAASARQSMPAMKLYILILFLHPNLLSTYSDFTALSDEVKMCNFFFLMVGMSICELCVQSLPEGFLSCCLRSSFTNLLALLFYWLGFYDKNATVSLLRISHHDWNFNFEKHTSNYTSRRTRL